MIAPARIERVAPGVHHAYRLDSHPPFTPLVFDRDALQARGWLRGTAGAGRGNADFIDYHGHPLVLREYRRGGAVRHLSRDRYVALGLSRSRPLREFRLLCELEALGLPVGRAFAALRLRSGPFERGTLITHRVAGRTLAVRLVQTCEAVPDALLESIGRCLARFHRAGAWHADLNAHNVIVDADDRRITLIDFDRGRLDAPPGGTQPPPAACANLSRLRRSLVRVLGEPAAIAAADRIEAAWRQAYASSVST